MSPQVLTIVSGTSGVIGLLSVISYFYYSYRVREIERSERSVRQIVEGEGLFNADQVLQILRTFGDDASRLSALTTLADISDKSAERVYKKIQGHVDIGALETDKTNNIRKASVGAGLLFLAIALIALIYSWLASTAPPITRVVRSSDLFSMSWKRDQPQPVGRFLGALVRQMPLGETFQDNACVRADDGWSLDSSKIQLMAPPHHPCWASRAGLPNAREMCFRITMSINRGDQDCIFNWEIEAVEIKEGR
jgi:hypothetical protein